MSDHLPPTPVPNMPMPSDPELQVAATDAVANVEAAAEEEAAATRRRWINLGEFVAVAGLIIATVGLWLNWSDRRSDLAEKQAARGAEARQNSRYEISGAVDRNGDIRILPDTRHPLGDVTIRFPGALGLAAQTSPAQTISRRWYERALLKATDGGRDTQTGILPVIVEVGYFENDRPMVVIGSYDIVWRTEGRMMLGRSLHIIGFKRRGGAIGQSALDHVWAASRRAG